MNTTTHRSTSLRAAPRPRSRRAPPLRAARALLMAAAVTVCAAVSGATAQGAAPADTSELVRFGNLYYGQGDCALAQYFFQEALKRDEANAEALVGKGRALSCQNAFNAAVDALRRAVEADDTYVPAYVHLALTYQDQFLFDPQSYGTRLSDALEIIQRAERIAPNDPTVHNTKGIVLYQAGSLDLARTTLERAVQLAAQADLGARERSTIQVNLGRAYRELGQLELAQQAFRRAVVLDPSSATAHNNLGNVLYRLGDCPGAEFELSQAVSLAPNSLSAVSQLAIAMFECGDVEGSIRRFEQALQLDGAVFQPPLFTYLARAYLEQGRLDEAVRRAQQGALLPPETAEAHYHLGRVYMTRRADGDRDAARRAFERALELDPNYTPAREALATLSHPGTPWVHRGPLSLDALHLERPGSGARDRDRRRASRVPPRSPSPRRTCYRHCVCPAAAGCPPGLRCGVRSSDPTRRATDARPPLRGTTRCRWGACRGADSPLNIPPWRQSCRTWV